MIELVGGPMDGHREVVPIQAADMPVYLFRQKREDGLWDVHAYQWAARSLAHGAWVLAHLAGVGFQGVGGAK